MRRHALIPGFLALLVTTSALAVGFYRPPCEEQQQAQDEAHQAIEKCFEKHFKENYKQDLAAACMQEFKVSAAKYREEQICIRDASLFRKK